MGYEVGYESMWNTIRCLANDGVGFSDEEISSYLREIEGDNYTFLHPENLLEYKQLNLLDNNLMELIVLLRQLVEELPASLWNPRAFNESKDWWRIHQAAKYIFEQLQRPKR